MSLELFRNCNIDRRPTRVELEAIAYPQRVKKILGNSAPRHLDMVGNLELLNGAGLGFCGARRSSEKGLETARDCSEQAAINGVLVVSGNAAGVDFEAHYTCLNAGGSTIFVLPEGINHFRIKRALKPVWDWNRVLVISQFQPDEPWKAFRAMTRNQLIIALSKVMIVIEAGETGGTLNAGKETLKSGVPLFVAEYQDMSVDARGNKILLDGGGIRLAKSKTTNRANLRKVFESVERDNGLAAANKQTALF